ncbi:MAG: hypothetical protein AAGD07_10345 [Planctomycetota bacterium]
MNNRIIRRPARKPRPTQEQPGTIGQTFAALIWAWHLSAAKDTSARDEWESARRIVMPHARREVRR